MAESHWGRENAVSKGFYDVVDTGNDRRETCPPHPCRGTIESEKKMDKHPERETPQRCDHCGYPIEDEIYTFECECAEVYEASLRLHVQCLYYLMAQIDGFIRIGAPPRC